MMFQVHKLSLCRGLSNNVTVEVSFIFGIVIGYILLGTTFCIYIIIS